jgi:glycosyltransferase involved in cell wall biosynthesis
MTPPRTILVDLRGAQFDEDRGIASFSQNLAAALARGAGERRWLFLHDAARPAPTRMAELASSGEWCTIEQACAAAIDAVVTGCFFLPRASCGAAYVLPPALLAQRPRRFGVVYDLVPWLFPDRYLSRDRSRRQYRESLGLLRGCDHLFGISRSTCDDVVRHAGIDPRRIHPIGGDIDEAKRALMVRPAVETADVPSRYGLVGPYCVTVGGSDWRKNLDGLVRAFARFRRDHPRQQLAIVCRLSPERMAALRRLAESLGLPARAVVCTGYVPDHELVGLVRHSAMLVYPSFYEGLGLPVLEAYGCGVPVVGSATSSVGELVIPELAVDPADPTAIAATMRRLAADPAVASRSLEFGRGLLAGLGWSRDAATMLQCLDGPRDDQRARSRQPRLAVVAALPPAETAIAAYTLRHLQSDRWTTSFYDANPGPRVAAPDGLRSSSRVLPVEVLRPALDRGRHSTVVHVLGNSEHHVKVLEAIAHTRAIPGVRRLAYLHEANLTVAFRAWLGDRFHDLPAAEPSAGGAAWIQRAIADLPGMGRGLRFLAERTDLDGLIVNSAACRDMIATALGRLTERWTIDVALLPVGPIDPAAMRPPAPDDELVVGTFGIAGDGKRLECLARSVSLLARRRPARLVMAGWNMARYARRTGLDALPVVRIHDRPDDATLRRLMREVHVAVQLRETTQGESSAAVVELLAAGTPLVVTGEGSFAELPPELARFVTADCPPETLADAIEAAAARRVSPPDLERILAALSPEAFARRFAEIVAA